MLRKMQLDDDELKSKGHDEALQPSRGGERYSTWEICVGNKCNVNHFAKSNGGNTKHFLPDCSTGELLRA